MIDSMVELLKKSDAVFITEYRGLSVAQITDCRRRIRNAGGEMKVCKNTLMRIALTECEMPQASEIDAGPNGYVMSYGDAAAVAKAIRDYSKEKGNEALVVKGAILGGKVLTQAQVFALATCRRKSSSSHRSYTRSRRRSPVSSRFFPDRSGDWSQRCLRSKTRKTRHRVTRGITAA